MTAHRIPLLKAAMMMAVASQASGCLTGGSGSGTVQTSTVRSSPPSSATTANGSVTLSWTAPTYNEDGSVLTDLDGYRIYWGTTPGQYPNSVTIDNESVTIYVLDNVPAGTYEFVATSFNVAGVESRYSSPVTKTVP